MSKILNIAIIGFGNRGHIYGSYARDHKDEYNLVAVCDILAHRREDAIKNYGCEAYADYKELLDHGYDLDLVVISTQDKEHCEHACYALNKGYNLILEKPIAVNEEDIIKVYETSVKNNCTVYVSHVLRYTPFYRTVKDVLDSGVIGEVVTINASENCAHWHYAHSYVRGNWHNTKKSCPMILAKTSHDFDIIRYLIGEEAVSVNSIGNLFYFNKAHRPVGAADKCIDCTVKGCIFNAQDWYTKYPNSARFFLKHPPTRENILNDITGSGYDVCVFGGHDNDVVDHQNTIIQFKNGKTASFTLTSLTKNNYRDLKVHCTKGDLIGNMEADLITVNPFGDDNNSYNVPVDFGGAPRGDHSGGDYWMMKEVYHAMNGEPCKGITLLKVSMESHLIALNAEKSRLDSGNTKYIPDLDNLIK